MAVEVGDLDEALGFYSRLFKFELRGRIGDRMAFIDMGDQFLAVSAGRTDPADGERHFGLVVDDPEAVRAAAQQEAPSSSAAAGSTSATQGATTSRSSPTPRSSSSARPA